MTLRPRGPELADARLEGEGRLPEMADTTAMGAVCTERLSDSVSADKSTSGEEGLMYWS